MSNNPTKEDEPALVAPNPNGLVSGTRYLGGSRYDTFNTETMTQAANSLWTDNSSPENKLRKGTACLEAMAGISPQDEAEGLLVAQMIACHSAAMECFRRAMIKEQTFIGRNQNLNFANKLSRTYALHMETLDRHRGKGQQTVRVEHVTVNAGGQAIVGNITKSGGSATNSEEQAHAPISKPIAHSQEPEVQGAFPSDRQAMPVPSNA